ncbi:isoprenyl transferase [Terrilactibacillus sp. BCM23-1]|uniref:Isoprenyl transferase n=1 Tax=Terrilactibacillus tamarindi TaxID=2599694 RepID=A0A6N8CRI0_9BACI|nr:isoprenyl transferase [Terrilactibacillus tamarindi]MTT32248.1 isoprenyl transferase [Terrilactibacillus tamarindi]
MLERFSLKRGKTKTHRHENLTTQDLNVPTHVAIIMDGNGRWANKRGLPRIAGHREGMKTVKKIVREASRMGIKVLTLYAFSTENWKRPKDEVEFLMKLPEQFLSSYLVELIEKNVQVQVMGDLDKIPSHTLRAVTQAKEKTEKNTGMILNFALNYGSRHEITCAVKSLIHDIEKGILDKETINEDMISNYLLSKSLPDPDLLIRTSGELRISNFMLWQIAYTEFWFTDKLWPDFSVSDLHEAVKHFSSRKRRYGGVTS